MANSFRPSSTWVEVDDRASALLCGANAAYALPMTTSVNSRTTTAARGCRRRAEIADTSLLFT
jgi:hypothetical protein